MSKPTHKAESQWLTILRELRVSIHDRHLKKWAKRSLSKARRRTEILEKGYRDMAADEEREREAAEWVR